MQAPTATKQKAAYLILTSASFHAASSGGGYQAIKTIDNCIRSVASEMTLPTLQESIELVSMLVWPKYDTL
jgi:hypothetical protein